jgi:HAD superfamily hydrolase (TIGR01458 family)
MEDKENPDVVVVGDLGKTWNFDIINNIFKKLLSGADLIALQKNKYWKTQEEGILIDAGAFIAGLEFAADKESILIGKPSPLYFKSGIKAAGCNESDNFIMIGDDLVSDISGAKNLNAKTILVLTGKSSEIDLYKSKIQPDFVVQDLFWVTEVLKTLF